MNVPPIVLAADFFLFERRRLAFEQIAGAAQLSPTQLNRWLYLLEARHRWCLARGIAHCVLISPDKLAVYPDKLPGFFVPSPQRPALQIQANVDPTLRSAILYPAEALRQARRLGDTYRRTDSCWTTLGGAVAATEVGIALGLKSVPRASADRMPLNEGTLPLPSFRRTHDGTVVLVFDGNDGTLPRGVIFHHGSARPMLCWLASGLSRLVAVEGGGFFSDLVLSEKPEFVISEIAELALAAEGISDAADPVVLPDDVRPGGFESCCRLTLPLPKSIEGTFAIDFRVGGNSENFVRDGWSRAEDALRWMTGVESTLALPGLRDEGDCELELDALAHVATLGKPAQRLAVRVNGTKVGDYSVSDLATLRCRLASDSVAGDTGVWLQFCHPDCFSPASLGLSTDDRQLAVALIGLRLRKAPATPNSPAPHAPRGDVGRKHSAERPHAEVQPAPPPGWSQALRGKLTAIVVDETTTKPIDRALAMAQLAAAAGIGEAARICLEEVEEAYGSQITRAGYEFENVLSTSLATQQFGLATQLIAQRFPSGWRPSLSLQKGQRSNQVRWLINQTGAAEFQFSPEIFQHDATRLDFLFWVRFLPLFERYHCGQGHVECGGVDVSLSDGGVVPELAACEYRPGYFLVPDPLFINANGYQKVRQHFDANDVPWDQRLPVGFWRGGTTGQRSGHWRTLQRARLCELASTSPFKGWFDVGLSSITPSLTPSEQEDLRQSGLMRPYVPPTDFNKYRYQIDVDGNTSSWPGLLQKLLTGSPVLKIGSPAGYRQWYYDRLVPMKNFILVAPDMSDLAEKLAWLRSNDARAREIGQNGLALAKSLDIEGELDRARDTITAAIRADRAAGPNPSKDRAVR